MPLTPTERQLAPPRNGVQWGIFRHTRSPEKIRTSQRTLSRLDPIRCNALPCVFSNSRDRARNWMMPPPGHFFRRMFFRHFARQEAPVILSTGSRAIARRSERGMAPTGHGPLFLPARRGRGYDEPARCEEAPRLDK